MNDDFFVLTYELNDNYPILAWEESARAFRRPHFIERDTPVPLRIGDPKPSHPLPADMLWLSRPVVSPRIAELILSYQIDSIQLLPANVSGFDSLLDYFLLHIPMPSKDWVCKERSNLESDEDGFITQTRKIVLDEKVLAQQNPKTKMLFRLLMDMNLYVVNRELKEALEAAKPTGMRFVPLGEWNTAGSPFGN